MGRDEAKRKRVKAKAYFSLNQKLTTKKRKEKQRYLNVHECIKSTSNSSQR